MKAKHTPGKWELEYDGSLVMNNHILCPPLGPDEASKEEKWANNQLIAAAPELLEALKGLVDYVGNISNSKIDIAIRAIKKATE